MIGNPEMQHNQLQFPTATQNVHDFSQGTQNTRKKPTQTGSKKGKLADKVEEV